MIGKQYTRKLASRTALAVFGCMMVSGMAIAADKIVVEGSTTVGPLAKAFAEYYTKANPSVNITVGESGSGNGAKALINGTCQVGTMSRAFKDTEKKAAEETGVLPIAHIVALDGLAVVVHPSNPLKDLTVEQIRRIYTGEVKNWKEVGGPDRPIVVVSRDTNSGTYECFESLVLKNQKIVGSAEYAGSNGAVRDRVKSTESAIGYVGLAFIEGVKAVAVNGVMVSAETVQNKTYPIARPLYMYTNGEPKEGTHVRKFVDLFKTRDGVRMVEDIGYVPVK